MKQTITIPDSWKDIKVSTFQEMYNCENNLIDRLSILIDQDPEDIKMWSLQSLNKISNMLAWSNELPNQETWKREIVIKGKTKEEDKTYYFKEKLSGLSGGEWLDIEMWNLDSVNNLHKIVGLMYDCESEIVKEHFNVQDCYGCIVFFSTIERNSLTSIEAYLIQMTAKMKYEQMKQYQKETKELKKKKSWLNGLGLTFFTRWQKGVHLN